MNFKFFVRLALVTTTLLLQNSIAQSAPLTPNKEVITSWIEIHNDTPDYSNISYTVSANYLEISVIGCGHHCQAVKMTTTPFDKKPDLVLNFTKNDGFCTPQGSFAIPFEVENGSLITKAQTYEGFGFGGYPCIHWLNIAITEQPNSLTRYKVNITNTY